MTKVFNTLFLLCFSAALFAQNPSSILQKAEAKLSGADLAAEVSIRTVRPRWERTMEAKIWNQGLDKTRRDQKVKPTYEDKWLDHF